MNTIPLQVETLQNDETISLISHYRKGDKEAKKAVIEGNVKLVISIVNHFKVDYFKKEDLFQIGIIGLMKAVDRFDDSYGIRFSTFATHIIKGRIFNYLNEDNPIKISRQYKTNMKKIKQMNYDSMIEDGQELTTEELAIQLQVSREEIVKIMMAEKLILSTNQIIQQDSEEKGICLEDIVESKNNNIEEWQSKYALSEALCILEPKEKIIIQKKYFEEKTQECIGELLCLSQAQVSRIEKKALKKMKNILL